MSWEECSDTPMNVAFFLGGKGMLGRHGVFRRVQNTMFDLSQASFQALVTQRSNWGQKLHPYRGVGSRGQFVTKFQAISRASGTSPKPPTNLRDLRHRGNPTPHSESHLLLLHPPNVHAINHCRCRCRRHCRLPLPLPAPPPAPSFPPSPPPVRRRSRPPLRRPSC